jgi:hypothetical protein
MLVLCRFKLGIGLGALLIPDQKQEKGAAMAVVAKPE